ncbi:MAG: SAM-dependent methyltransferase [Pseudomonadota bacterium]|nr:SAM-dependent methyltransferase [Pseudomonadota bacterium]
MSDKPHSQFASDAIQALLHGMIAQAGAVPVSQFIALALGHPEYGYYRRQNPIGASGDFTTAAEISGLFGEMCGVYLAHMFEIAGQPDYAQIVELGPGRGSLMADMRHSWAQTMPAMTEFPTHLIETSPQLRKLQRQRINTTKMTWHNDVQNLPQATLFGVANEFFDALPVDQAIWRQPAWRHRLVSVTHGTLSFVDGPALSQAELAAWQISNDQTNMIDGAIAEYCPVADQIIKQIAGRIACHGGACLVIDYGKNDNYSDSLQAVAAHKPVDLFHQPGNADISHWVDFGALRRAAVSTGAHFFGPVTQADFLMSIGLRERAENAARLCDAVGRRALYAAVDRLVGAHHMGTAFKVGLIVAAGAGVPVGFRQGDIS